MRSRTSFIALLLPIFLLGVSASVKATTPQLMTGMTIGNSDQETSGAVSIWQEYLIQGGYLKISKPSGVFGGLTGQATEAWQKDHGIAPTSPSVGPRVRTKLKELTEAASKSSTPIQLKSQASHDVTVIPTPAGDQVTPLATCFERRVPESYSTIGEAIRATCANDVVLIGPGTYEESLINFIQPITIRGSQGRERTIIQSKQGPAVFISTPVSGLVFEGLTLIGAANQPAMLINISSRLASPLGLTLKNSALKKSESGLSVSAPLGEIFIERTIIAENRTDGISDNFGGTITLINNTITQNDTGYSLQNLGGQHILTNNIIAKNKTDGVAVSYLGKETTLDMNYNNVANNDKNNYYTYRDTAAFVPRGLGNVSYNPGFVSQNDYRLISTSKLIDAGDPKSPPDEDGTRSDIGALAFDQRQLKSGANFFVNVGKLLLPIISWMW